MNHSINNYGRFRQPFTLAVIIELAVFSSILVYYFYFSKPVLVVHNDPVTLTLQQVVTPTPPKPAPPKPVHKVIPQPIHKVIVPKTITPPTPVKQVADAFSHQVTPPPVEQQPVNQSLKNKLLAEYLEKLRQAVQTALIYPIAAKQMGITGRVRVQFQLNVSQQPINSKVLESSGTGMFDRYALKAVNEANYPQPPKEISSSNQIYEIWVEFKG